MVETAEAAAVRWADFSEISSLMDPAFAVA
jgi:hypothetical protein